MGISRRKVLASVLSAGGAAVAGDRALASQSNEPRVLSGSDLGFRIHGTARDGAPIGELVVRIDGKWVPTQFQPVLRRAT
jgi:hypothetical protein